MNNYVMETKLKSGECFDVREIGPEIEPGVFRLPAFVEQAKDFDYADAQTETWIWSIGRHKATGEIHAAVDARFYQNPDYECLWLR